MNRLLASFLAVALFTPAQALADVNWDATDALAKWKPPPRKFFAATPANKDQGDIVVIPLKACDAGCPLTPRGQYYGYDFYKFNQDEMFNAVIDFFGNHADRYDVLVSFTTFHTNQLGGAYYMPIANDVAGIGAAQRGRDFWSMSDQFGSQQLHGFVYLGDLYQCDFMHAMRIPLACSDTPPYPETSYSLYGVMGQEMGHQWGSFVQFMDKATNAPSKELLGRDSSHWSYLMNTGGSPMEGNHWEETTPGSFKLVPTEHAYYSELDQYLMGLRPASDVKDFFFIRKPAQTVDVTAAPGSAAQKVDGTRVDVSVNDIIAAEGPRTPDFTSSRKVTHEAFVLFVIEGTKAADINKEVQRIREVRRAWKRYFHEATDRRGRVRSTLSGREDLLLFDFRINEEGWQLTDGNKPVTDGALHVVPGLSPASGSVLHSELELDPTEYKAVQVTMTVPPSLAGHGKLEFAGLDGDFAKGGAQSFTPLADGQPHTYQFSLGKQAAWSSLSRIGALRFTPTDASGDGKGEVLIDLIEGFADVKGDDDDDAVPDSSDNCRYFKNPDQLDANKDGIGDVCEPWLDGDKDGVPDSADNCIVVANSLQEDRNKDGVGDACAPDADADLVEDALDNCPKVANSRQEDRNGDGIGDACAPDSDGDGIEDALDNCASVANADQADSDGDGSGDACVAKPDTSAGLEEPKACGCGASTAGALPWFALLALFPFRRRRLN